MEYIGINGDFVHNCMEAIGFGKFHVLMLLSLGLRSFLRGSSNCMLSILQPYLRCHLKLSIFTASWLGTVLAIGRLFGAVLIGRMADKYGRRRSMLCLFSLHTLLSLLNALSSSYTMILVTRSSTGLVFEAVMLIYTYGMELLPIKKRHYLAVIDGFYGFGFLFAIFSAIGILGTINWRWYVVVNETIPIAICTLLVAFLPESPRYLYSKGYVQEAVKSLERIAVTNGIDLHHIVSESEITNEDVSCMFAHRMEENCGNASLGRAQSDSTVITEQAADESYGEDRPKREKRVLQQVKGCRPLPGGGNDENAVQLQSDGRQDKGVDTSLGAEPQTTANTILPKSELYKRIVVLTCLRFAVQVFGGVFMFGSMQFKNPSAVIACGSCSTNMNYRFVITLAVALETGFLISFFMSGKYNRKFALQVIFAVRALLVMPFYFGISQWMKIPFYFTSAVANFSLFIIVNIYASEVIPTSHRALATGIENTAGNVGLFIGDFFALYLVHVNYYAVLAALQGVTIVAILIISAFVIDTKDIPLFDS